MPDERSIPAPRRRRPIPRQRPTPAPRRHPTADGRLHRGDPFTNARRAAHSGPTPAKAYPGPAPSGIPPDSLGHRLIPARMADGCASRAPHGADPRAFSEGVRPQIWAKLEEEIKALNGIKFQLALKVQLRKDNPDGSEEYTDPVLRHKQEAILQNSEIRWGGGAQSSFPHESRNS